MNRVDLNQLYIAHWRIVNGPRPLRPLLQGPLGERGSQRQARPSAASGPFKAARAANLRLTQSMHQLWVQ
jgi:hypothetical protein